LDEINPIKSVEGEKREGGIPREKGMMEVPCWNENGDLKERKKERLGGLLLSDWVLFGSGGGGG